MPDVFKNRIGGIEKLTLVDYEGNLSCILFYNGCNLKCPYCYNIELAHGKANTLDADDIISFLINRVGKLTGVVFSGGECTVHGEKLKEDIKFVKSLGYKVKVDTNGSNPKLLKELLDENLVDYVALDYKAPFEKTAKLKAFKPASNFISNFIDTLKCVLIPQDKVKFEVRTTVHTQIIDEECVNKIIDQLQELGYKGNYYVQFFFPGPETIAGVDQHPRRFNADVVKKYADNKDITVFFRNEMYN